MLNTHAYVYQKLCKRSQTIFSLSFFLHFFSFEQKKMILEFEEANRIENRIQMEITLFVQGLHIEENQQKFKYQQQISIRMRNDKMEDVLFSFCFFLFFFALSALSFFLEENFLSIVVGTIWTQKPNVLVCNLKQFVVMLF